MCIRKTTIKLIKTKPFSIKAKSSSKLLYEFYFSGNVLLTLFFRMPIGTQEAIRCPRCNQAVFHAEAIPAAGKQWHKTCYRCGMYILSYLKYSIKYNK